jgi:hypothetical protein
MSLRPGQHTRGGVTTHTQILDVYEQETHTHGRVCGCGYGHTQSCVVSYSGQCAALAEPLVRVHVPVRSVPPSHDPGHPAGPQRAVSTPPVQKPLPISASRSLLSSLQNIIQQHCIIMVKNKQVTTDTISERSNSHLSAFCSQPPPHEHPGPP